MNKINVLGLAFGSGGSEILEKLRATHDPNTMNFNIIKGSRFAEEKIKEGVSITDTENIKIFIDEMKPDVLLTETSNEIGYERMNHIIKYCKIKKIKTIHILDVYSLNMKRYEEPTDYIITPKENVSQDLIKLLPHIKILPLGNPTFDNLETNHKHILHRNPKVLFTSQPSQDNSNELICRMISFWLTSAVNKGLLENFSLEVKAHPRENQQQRLLWNTIPSTKLIQWDDTKDFTPELINYDIIVGRNSTVMLKASKMGINTIYIEDLFLNHLQKMYLDGYVLGQEYKNVMSNGNATTNIHDFIKSLI